MGLLDMFNKDKKKKASDSNSNNNSNNNPLANLRRNIEGIGRPGTNTFAGSGQSLGGSKPGAVIHVELVEQGPLGIRVEKKSSNSGSAIVSLVMEGTQAERSGLQRGDVLCFSGSGGQNEIPYQMFLDICKSTTRPIHLEARRFVDAKPGSASASATSNVGRGKSGSADAEARRKAMIAAAEAREKKHKSQTKTIKHVTKSTLLRQQQQNGYGNDDVNNFTHEQLRPQTEASRQAMEAAKRNEASLAAELGYNPYESIKKTAGQARSATTATQHGIIQGPSGTTTTSGGGGTAGNSNIPVVAPPANPTTSVSSSDDFQNDTRLPLEFREALAEVVSYNHNKEASKNGLKIARTLAKNATTKGQLREDEVKAEKFRKVRLTNAKIQAAIVDVPGNLQLLLAVGFQLTEDSETNESLLVFPPFYKGPEWLPIALKSMEDCERAL